MEVSATLKQAHISAQKARLVADQVRGMPVEKAVNLLTVQHEEGGRHGAQGAASLPLQTQSTTKVRILMN